jgi:phosphate transport system substrate-binding protein
MKNDQVVGQDEAKICRWCGHNANANTATVCEVCDRPLDKAPLGLPVLLIGLSALVLLVGGGSYWVWQRQPVSRSAATISRAPDIRIYRSMKDVPNVPPGLFNYHSALPFAAIIASGMHDTIHTAFPGFRLRYTEPLQGNSGSNTAIRMLIDGEVSIAKTTRPLEDAEIERARSRNITLDQIPVAIDGIAFYVNPKLSIPGLSLNQAQDIYLGKITNWKQVGGPDLAIVPFSLDPKAVGSPKQALGDVADQMSPTVRIIRNHTEGISRVASTPGAISFGGTPTILGQKMIRPLSLARANTTDYGSPVTTTGDVNKQAFRDGTYPLTRRAFIVIRRNGSLDEQASVACVNLFLSEERQRIIEKAGFVALYRFRSIALHRENVPPNNSRELLDEHDRLIATAMTSQNTHERPFIWDRQDATPGTQLGIPQRM